MSLIDQAKIEMKYANFGQSSEEAMLKILHIFFEEWDSGGAVAFAQPALMKLIAGKPLTPLTGDADEWNEVGEGVYQNKRCSTVFKDPRFFDGKLAYDIDDPRWPELPSPITFPYNPREYRVKMPLFTIGGSDEAHKTE